MNTTLKHRQPHRPYRRRKQYDNLYNQCAEPIHGRRGGWEPNLRQRRATWTLDGAKTYTRSGENRLIRIEASLPQNRDKKLEFGYDYRGRRIRKTVSEYTGGSWQVSTKHLYLYDKWNVIATYDALDNDTMIKTHTWGTRPKRDPTRSRGSRRPAQRRREDKGTYRSVLL